VRHFVVGALRQEFYVATVRNHSMERGFVVVDADLSPERRLVGAEGQGVATYRELMQNISTKAVLTVVYTILEGWINGIQNQVAQDTGMRPNDNGFDDQVESRILTAVKDTEGLVHGFAFTVITTYWRGYRLDDDNRKGAALRWLRGEFATRARQSQRWGVRY